MMRVLLFVLFVVSLPAFCQEVGRDVVDVTIINGDTLFVKKLPEITVVPRPRTEFDSRRQRRLYGRLLRDVKRTLPLAKKAASMLIAVNDTIQTLPTKQLQSKYLKEMEKKLLAEYEPVLRRMSRRQGSILLKLIDRECEMTSFEVVKIYRGSFSAFFWQGVAKIFGSNLKSNYDKNGEDRLIEEVVLLVEAGVV